MIGIGDRKFGVDEAKAAFKPGKGLRSRRAGADPRLFTENEGDCTCWRCRITGGGGEPPGMVIDDVDDPEPRRVDASSEPPWLAADCELR